MTTTLIREAMDRITADTTKISMGRGKMYTTVAARIEAARYIFGDAITIETEILVHPELKPGRVENDAVVVMKACIYDENRRLLATGHAEELRGSNRMTETSALEVCETSAIGRALASLGLHGGEYASANEIDIAKAKSAEGRSYKPANGRKAGGQEGTRPDAEQDPFTNHGNNQQPAAPVETRDEPEQPRTVGGGGPVLELEPAPVVPVSAAPEDEGVVPVAVAGGSPKGIALEAFRTFAADTESLEELKQFWGKNKKILMDLKEESPDDFALVRAVFAKRELELKGAKPK